MADLPYSHRHRKLPAELNREIYLCFKPATQRRFIWGLGWDFYTMFRQKLLKKTKRVCNPNRNGWNRTTTEAIVLTDGLRARNSNARRRINIYAEKGFAISGKHFRGDSLPGTIIYYYEVKGHLRKVGLSDVDIPDPADLWIGVDSNSYAFQTDHYGYSCLFAGEERHFELSEGGIQPIQKRNRNNVYGCGLVLDPEDKLAIFFSLNGKLLGQKISINNPTVDRLFPAVQLFANTTLKANFGDDPTKPFEYDIKNCPGLELACI